MISGLLASEVAAGLREFIVSGSATEIVPFINLRRDIHESAVSSTLMDDTLPGGPTERTVSYRAPFFKPDREQDYRVAWEILRK